MSAIPRTDCRFLEEDISKDLDSLAFLSHV